METSVRHVDTDGHQLERGHHPQRIRTSAHSAEPLPFLEQSFALRVANLINQFVFFSMLGLIFLSAIPYGTVEPWWKAVLVSLVFLLWIVGTIESLLGQPRKSLDGQLLMPLFALVAFALIQSLPLGPRSNSATPYPVWNAISADPYQTQFFAAQLLALTLAGALLARYATSDRRIDILIKVVIAVAVASAVFGVLRQTNQRTLGFGLPLLSPGLGYGQFINPHHFAILMEMAFGLMLGLVLGGGVKREWTLVYGAMLLVVWTALILSNSRGGLLAMMAQIVVTGLLFTTVVPASKTAAGRLRALATLRSLPARIVLLIVLLTGVVIGTLWIGGDRLAGRFDNLSGSGSAEARQGGSRNEIWRATWQMFKANPFTGVGLGGYWAAIPAYHDAAGSLTPQEAHNDYLELLASGGIVGALLGLWFLVVLARRIAEGLRSSSNSFRRASRYGATVGITGIAVHSLFDFGLHMMVNALVFAALVVIATRGGHGNRKFRRSNA